jgi:hypothetical protein
LDWFSAGARSLLAADQVHQYPGVDSVKGSAAPLTLWSPGPRPGFEEPETSSENRALSRLRGIHRNLLEPPERRLVDAAALRSIRAALHYRTICHAGAHALEALRGLGDEWLYWAHLYFDELVGTEARVMTRRAS